MFAAAAAYPKGDDIRRHIHPETWNFLQKRFRESNYLGKGFWLGQQYVPGLQNLRPWAIAYYIWGIRGYSDIHDGLGVDNYIGYQAKRMGKGRAGLETAEQHVDVLRGMSDIDAELILLDSLVRGDKRRDDFNATRAGWKEGNTGPMMADAKRDRDQNLGAELRLLDYRNLRWIPKIVGLIKSGIPTVDRCRNGTPLRHEQRDRSPAEKGLQNRAALGLIPRHNQKALPKRAELDRATSCVTEVKRVDMQAAV